MEMEEFIDAFHDYFGIQSQNVTDEVLEKKKKEMDKSYIDYEMKRLEYIILKIEAGKTLNIEEEMIYNLFRTACMKNSSME